jgi:DNA primase
VSDIVSSLFAMAPSLAEGARPTDTYVLVRCPFHGGGNEKTPSMSVARDKPVFFCHACQESGHVSRLFRHFGVSKETVDVFLANAGLNVPYQKEKAGKVAAKLSDGVDPFRGQYLLDEDILDFYRQAPTYLLKSGFEKKTLRHFEVGFDSTNLRITFPIRNVYGNLLGVSGRAIMDGQEPRYKIYKQELINRKDFRVPSTYTMDAAKEVAMWHGHLVFPYLLKRDEPVVIVEGFKACMWVWQSGYQAVVALVGAYLSEFHAEIVATHTKKAILFLDNNKAGHKGAFFGARRLMEKGVVPQIITYPDDRQQPDELNPEEVRTQINEPRSFREWREEHRNVADEASSRIRLRW